MHFGEAMQLSTFSSCKNVNIVYSLGCFISGHFDIRILDIGNLTLGALVGKYKLDITGVLIFALTLGTLILG